MNREFCNMQNTFNGACRTRLSVIVVRLWIVVAEHVSGHGVSFIMTSESAGRGVSKISQHPTLLKTSQLSTSQLY